MSKALILSIAAFIASSAVASMSAHHQEGKSFAEAAIEQAEKVSAFNMTKVPGYQASAPTQSQLKANQLKAAAVKAAESDGDVKVIHDSLELRPKTTIDPATDDLIADADAVLKAADEAKPEDQTGTSFCASGDCVDQSYAANQDMGDAMAKLSIFKEMQNDKDSKAQIVFTGKSLRCSKKIADFKDCCADKGWGRSVGLASCSAEEKDLAQQRQLNQCVMVGSYCAERKLRKCIKRKTTYCCYPTKLARLVNEQGKKQLGLGFGSPKKPQCGGLSVQQISKLDFAKIDLSELVQDIQQTVKQPNSCKITEDLKKVLSDKARMTTNDQKTQGRAHGDF